MENVNTGSYVQRKLKRLYTYYAAAGVFFLVCLSSSLLFGKYLQSLDETMDKLRTLQVSLLKMDMAQKEIRASLSVVESIVPRGVFEEPPEAYLYKGLDDLKARMAEASIVLAPLEIKEDEVRLPLTLTGPIADYRGFVLSVGYLQVASFPFFAATSLVISRQDNDGKVNVHYEIQGALTMPRSANGSGGQAGGRGGA
jgi:hypothetical protein